MSDPIENPPAEPVPSAEPAAPPVDTHGAPAGDVEPVAPPPATDAAAAQDHPPTVTALAAAAAAPPADSAPAATEPQAAAAAPDEVAATEAPAPAVPELSPAATGTLLAQHFPALFGAGNVKPIKLRIQADIQARAPGLVSRKSLSLFLHRHTTSTAYLRALVASPQRFDLDGEPAGEVAAEHRDAATVEVERRRGIVMAKRQAERQAQRQNQRPPDRPGDRAAAGQAMGPAPAAQTEGAAAPGDLPPAAGEGQTPRPPRPPRPPHPARADRPPGGRPPGERPAGARRGPPPQRQDRPAQPRHERPPAQQRPDRPVPAHPDRRAHPARPQAQHPVPPRPQDGPHRPPHQPPRPPREEPVARAEDPALALLSQAERDARRERALLLRAWETSTLTKSNFCVLKRISEADLDAQVALARQERPAQVGNKPPR